MTLEEQIQAMVDKTVKERIALAVEPLKKKIDLLEKCISPNVGTEEALHILGVSENTLRKHRGDSAIIWSKVGKKDLYDRMSLYAFRDSYRMRDLPSTLKAA